MIELDFIPDWYRADRNRRVWHQRKYVIVGLCAIAIACGLMLTGRNLSQAQAKLAVLRSEFESGISQVQRYRQLQLQLEGLEKSARMLESVSPRTPYSAVLAELSHCVAPEIVLSKLSFQMVPVEDAGPAGAARQKPNRVQLGTNSASNQSSAIPLQTELTLQGIAVNGSVVAELIAALEQSEYFSRVVPSYSKNAKFQDCDVSEFEIRCVVADFETIR